MKPEQAETVAIQAELEQVAAPVVGAIIRSQGETGMIGLEERAQLGALEAIAQAIGGLVGPQTDNFPSDPVQRWKLDNAATTGTSLPLQDCIGQEITPRYWRVEAVRIEDHNNGEIMVVPRVVLFDRSGKVFHASSVGVFQVVASFARVFKRDELPEDFRLLVASIKTRAGYRMLTLQGV